MITLKDIKKSVIDIIKANSTVEINSRDIKEGFSRPSFFIQLANSNRSDTEQQINRKLTIRIYYFPSSRYEHNIEILEMQELLEEMFSLKLEVDDRKFNIIESESDITDGVLQFKFDIDYSEGKEFEDEERMEDLYYN